MSHSDIPKALRWQTLVVVGVVAVIAIMVGVGFAGPMRLAISSVGQWLGFGHAHDEQAVAVTDDAGQVQYYTCGMHPWVILPKPGDCPICHMELTPIDADKFTGEIAIDPVIVQNMGVRVEPVITGPLTKTIRTVGTIDYNERAVRDVNIKTPGWIEKLYVDFVGAKVEAGDPLFELYSPQLYAAQEEYLLAMKNQGRVGSALSPGASKGATDLLDAARTRLEYFDITEKQIAELTRVGKPAKTMTIESPYTGVVIAKHANEGMNVDPGMQVYRIADLSTVWVLVTLYEYQLPYVEAGMNAVMSLPYIPGQRFKGEVIYIYPYLDKKTREVQLRLEFDNPNNLLKPGMFASVTLENTLAAEKTLVPRSAVIDTGERQVAFVSKGEGKFEPRDVQLGIETGDGFVEIISGLKPGEMVVTSGQFLIDSEAKIREALAKMIKGDLASEQQVTAKVAGAAAFDALPQAVADRLNQALKHYLAISELLVEDTTQGIAAHAEQLAAVLDELVEQEMAAAPHFWHQNQDAVATARANAFKLMATQDLAEARLQFAQVSTALQTLLLATGVPTSFGSEVQILHCPMYHAGQGGTIWLQAAGDVRNPYMGQRMLECFDQRQALPTTGSGPATAPATDASQTQPAAQQQIDDIVARYLAVQQMLTEDQWGNAGDELRVLQREAEQLASEQIDALSALAKQVAMQAAFDAKDITAFRDGFAGLSKAVLALVKAYPPSPDAATELYHAYCPMVKRDWLQASRAIRNPYAPYMLECGTIEKQIELSTTSSQQDEAE